MRGCSLAQHGTRMTANWEWSHLPFQALLSEKDEFSCGSGFATYVPQEMVEKPNVSGRWGAWKCIYTPLPIVWPRHLFSADEKTSPPEDRSCPHCDFAAPVVLCLSPRTWRTFPQGAAVGNGSAETNNDFRTSKYFTLFCRGWMAGGGGVGVYWVIINIPKSRNP